MINIIFCDFLYCFGLITTMYLGTKLVNYYYNFYHIYKFLDHEQKLGYFKNNYLVGIITQNNFIKKMIVYYLLIPLIKINYIFILLFVTLLYSLCHHEFNKFIQTHHLLTKNQNQNKIDNDSDEFEYENKNIENLYLVDNFKEYVEQAEQAEQVEQLIHLNNTVEIEQNNPLNLLDIINLKHDKNTNDLTNNINVFNLSNEISNIQNITNDYDNNITNIMNFLSDTTNDSLNNKNYSNNLINNDKIKSIDKSEEIHNTTKNLTGLNLLNEITTLSNKEILKNINDDNPNDIPNDLEDYLVIDNIKETHIENKLKSDQVENNEININDIDFGTTIEDFGNKISNNKINNNLYGKENTDDKLNQNPEIIRIGKRKKK